MGLNPIKKREVEKALRRLGRATVQEVVDELDKTVPQLAKPKRSWDVSDVHHFLRSINEAVNDVDNPKEWVWAEDRKDREFYTRSRYWDN